MRALAALRRCGFVDWVRRYEPTGNTGAGPQVRQVSNAYRLALPPAAERLLGRAGEDAPVPKDHERAVETRRAAFRVVARAHGAAAIPPTPPVPPAPAAPPR